MLNTELIKAIKLNMKKVPMNTIIQGITNHIEDNLKGINKQEDILIAQILMLRLITNKIHMACLDETEACSVDPERLEAAFMLLKQ